MFSEKKKIPRQIKDQLNPLVQKLMNICSSVKNLNKQAEWEEINAVLELLKNIQDIEAKYQSPRSDRSNHWKAFYEWCSKNRVEFSSVAIQEIEDGDYGVFAKKNIEEAEKFLTVPRKIMMTELSAKNSKLEKLISSDVILQNMPNVQLAMHLLVESLDQSSFWMPYISILPLKYNTILYFSFEEIKALQGSPLIDEIFTIIRSVARQYCYFFQLFQKDPGAISLNVGPYFTYDLYRWAVSSVMTRQNAIPTPDGQVSIALIPFFDMCNHINGKLTTDFDLETDSLISYSFKSFPKGNEVCMFYGPRSNGEYFVHNGFVYPENEYDAVEIKLGISKNDRLHTSKTSLCGKLNISINGPFYVYSSEEIAKDIFTFLQINVMKADELEKALQYEGEKEESFLEDSDLKKRAYSFLKDRIFLLLRSYKTTLEEDEEFLKQDVFESAHQRFTVMQRFCEKRILTKTYNLCLRKIKEFVE